MHSARFRHKVKDWVERKPGMDIFVKHVLHKGLPGWVEKKQQNGESAVEKKSASTELERATVADVLVVGEKRRAEVSESEPAAKRSVPDEMEAVVAAVERREDLEDWAAPGEGGGSDGSAAAEEPVKEAINATG